MLAACRQALEGAITHLSGRDLDAIAPEAFALAGHLARHEAVAALADWAEGHGETSERIAELAGARHCADLQAWLSQLGLPAPEGDLAPLASERRAGLGARILESATPGGPTGLNADHAALQEGVERFAKDHLDPVADAIHRDDRLIGEPLIAGLAALGVFGLSIPERWGGCFTDHRAVVVATEALSRSSLGAGGSVITRPEICAKALLAGGSDAQKQRWLPAIASGERMVCVAVTEPDAGSDVAAVRLRASPVPGGYALRGEKTWCTFAGRADLLLLVARTGGPGHRGLSLFLVDKPPSRERAFAFTRGGGHMAGRAIPTIGYRGMHSFSVVFEDWFVPADARIGDEGEGFGLMMQGFVGGRIQTAARAVGVMQAALEDAVRYARERRVFGSRLGDLTLTRCTLAEMAVRVQAGRQLALRVADRLDGGTDAHHASLVKLMTCRDAEWVTREAMQLHGGMGYSEEYRVSRLWQDARVLSIFEGAEEVLALRVVARGLLGGSA